MVIEEDLRVTGGGERGDLGVTDGGKRGLVFSFFFKFIYLFIRWCG